MGSRKHRWPADDTPLTGCHGGTAKAAQRAIKAAREARQYERARKAVLDAQSRAVMTRLDAQYYLATRSRKDKLRPQKMVPKKGAAAVTPTLMEVIAFMQHGRCVLCARALEFGIHPIYGDFRPSYEHVIPRSLGGRNVGNRLVSHRRCNSAKGSAKPTGCELLMLLAVNARLGVEPTRF